jgi:hypothetical protein
MKTCTVPGGVVGAATEFTLERGATFYFSSQPPARRVKISPRFQRLPSRSSSPRQGLLLVVRANIPERLEPTRRKAKGRVLSLDATAVRGFGWFKNSSVSTITVKEK